MRYPPSPPTLLGRRGFLALAAPVGLAAIAGPSLTSGISTAPDWRALGRGLDGRLVRPSDAAYDRARRLFNPAFDKIRPAAIAYCATPADVAECVAFARRYALPITPRSGGHSYAGWSTGTGLVVDVSPMATVRYAAPAPTGSAYATGLATVGAGAKLVDVYAKLAKSGVSIPAGSCPSVGVAGLTLGGGIGVVSRQYGLTCDALTELRMVMADGRQLVCSPTSNPDLFWASRGGGGGNFGIATSFTFQTHPIREVTVFFLHWRWSRAAAVLRAWQAWAPTAPDALWSNLHLSHDPDLDVTVGGLYLGSKSACERQLQRLTDRVGRDPSSRYVRQTPYQQAMMIMAGCSSYSVSQCHRPGSLPGETGDGKLVRDTFSAKSHFAYAPLSDAGITALLGQVAKPGRHTVLLDAFGGAIARVSPEATAFPHRKALYSVQYYAHFAQAKTWTRAAHAAMRPFFGDHAYVNYVDPELTGWRRQYYGANAARLAQVKAVYDPGRLFRLPQGV